MDINSIKRALGRTVVRKKESLYLSTSSTLLNMACSGRADGGLAVGKYVLFVGDSQAGKTFLGLGCLAEAAHDPRFKDYRLIYDPTEHGAMMDIEKFFGSSTAQRLEYPAEDENGSPLSSHTSEEFYFNLDTALRGDKPCIYVLDSQDGLSSEAEGEKFEERKKAHKEGKEVSGSYGDNKAKVHSANLRRMMGPLEETGSILLIINQTRDSFEPFKPKTYSGGRALLFYASLQLWSSVDKALTKVIKSKKRQLGNSVKVRVKKNRMTGRDRSVVVPIYHSYGIDDVGSCVDYLIGENQWKKAGKSITVTGLGPQFKGDREKVIRHIEKNDLEEDLRGLVETVWNQIEAKCIVERKARYE